MPVISLMLTRPKERLFASSYPRFVLHRVLGLQNERDNENKYGSPEFVGRDVVFHIYKK